MIAITMFRMQQCATETETDLNQFQFLRSRVLPANACARESLGLTKLFKKLHSAQRTHLSVSPVDTPPFFSAHGSNRQFVFQSLQNKNNSHCHLDMTHVHREAAVQCLQQWLQNPPPLHGLHCLFIAVVSHLEPVDQVRDSKPFPS